MFLLPRERSSLWGCIYHAVPPGPPTPDPLPPLHQLLPDRRQIDVRALLDQLTLAAHAPIDRPYAIVNFVASADGHAAYRGRSRWLSDDADREIFHGLREHVDAILVGTGTLRTERYGRMIRDPERRQRRAASGLAPDPIACVFSRSGDIPTSIPLFDDPSSRIVVFTPSALDTSGLGAQVEVVRLGPDELTLTTMMRRLRSAYDVRSLLCEGGPTLFGALLQEDLVDELFISLAPKLTGGGTAPAITSGPELAELRRLDLRWALELGNSLYLRYAIR
jgi:riboflavin-specific deaminase-like protein